MFTTTTGGYDSVTALTLNAGSGATHSFSGIITNGAAGMILTKSGLGTQILTADNTYTGTTTVSAGTLIVNGHQTAATGVVSVASGATLGGVGTIGGDTTISGSLRVGNDTADGITGSLGFSNKNLSFESDSFWLIDIVGNNFDAISGINSLSIGSDVTLNFTFTGIQTQSTYTIASYGSRSGIFNFAEGANVGGSGGGYLISYGDGLSDTITLTAVPEPSTVIFLGLLLAGALYYKRRQMVKTPQVA